MMARREQRIMTHTPSYLIVSADDFGYFRCVSLGIVEAHRRGIVTATGVLANGPGLARDIDLLRSEERLDLGVHLNVTTGSAVSATMRGKYRHTNGMFSGKLAFASAYLSGRIRTAEVEEEWRAQVQHCLDQGLRLAFLNSHEHIHMFPALFGLLQQLASDYGIPYVRLAKADGWPSLHPGALLRDTVIKVLEVCNIRNLRVAAPFFIGLRSSGRLTVADIEASVQRMVPGRVYELMCHPGHLDESEVGANELLAYHDWERELATLCNPDTRALLEARDVRLIGFRDLPGLAGVATLQGPAKT